jgi:hypothetical protein
MARSVDLLVAAQVAEAQGDLAAVAGGARLHRERGVARSRVIETEGVAELVGGDGLEVERGEAARGIESARVQVTLGWNEMSASIGSTSAVARQQGAALNSSPTERNPTTLLRSEMQSSRRRGCRSSR